MIIENKMALKRNHKGIEGYFYRKGNCKLTVEPGLIMEAKYEHDPRVGYTALVVRGIRAVGTHFHFYMPNKEDYESLFNDFGVKDAEELEALPSQRRMVLVYDHRGCDSGLSVCGADRSIGRPRI